MPKSRKDDLGEENPTFDGENGQLPKDYGSTPKSLQVGNVEDVPGRDQWSNPIEFLLSCVAMSVGLGNVWRFPFTAYENGGGAFLVPYILVLIFIGKPLYYMELCMGQFSSYGCVKVWEMVPGLKGIGYAQALGTWSVVTYYVSLMALTVFYFFASFQSVLPWSTCPEDIADCIDINTNLSLITNINETVSAAEVFFDKKVLFRHPRGLDDGIFAPEWRLSLCLLFSWIVILLILIRGVKSSGKASYFTALFPYVVLITLLIRGATLPGAVKGIIYFITPDWSKLLEPQVWYAAVTQSFFSLSVGFGSIIMFASYNNFRHNVFRDAAIISVVDTCTSLLAGFTIFSILGHLAELMGVDSIDEVIKGGGASLAFISYPDVLTRFDYIPQLFAVLFFLMLFTLGVGSATALTGCIITIICDEFTGLRRDVVTAIVSAIGFFSGLFYVTPQGQYILEIVDFYGGTFVIMIMAIMEVIAVQWIYGFSRFTKDIEFMLNRKTGLYWRFCWVFLIPLVLIAIFVYKLVGWVPLKSGGYVFKIGANAFGFTIVGLAVGVLILSFVLFYLKKREQHTSLFSAFKSCFVATEDWCPKNPVLRKQYFEFLQENSVLRMSQEGIDNPAVVMESVAGSGDKKYPSLSSFRTSRE